MLYDVFVISLGIVGGVGAAICSSTDVSIDDDGDVSFKVERASGWFRSNSITVFGWITTPQNLASGQDPEQLANIIDALLKLRVPFLADRYYLRLVFSFWFEERRGLGALRSRFLDGLLQSVMGGAKISEIDSFRTLTKFQRGQFSDSVEVEASTTTEVQLL